MPEKGTPPSVIIGAAATKEALANQSNLLIPPQILTKVEEEADHHRESDPGQDLKEMSAEVGRITNINVILEAEVVIKREEAEVTNGEEGPPLAILHTHLRHLEGVPAENIIKRVSGKGADLRIERKRAGSPSRRKRSGRCKPVLLKLECYLHFRQIVELLG